MMPNPDRVCPHPECDRPIRNGLFACRDHWFDLSAELRSRIWSNYRSGDPERILSGYDEADHEWASV